MTETMSIDNAVEAITVAISLGMVVPAIEGMTVWEGGFTGYGEASRYEIVVTNCASEEVALSSIRNEALVEIVKAYNFDESVRARIGDDIRSLKEYILHAPTEDIIIDYEHFFGLRFDLNPVRIVSKPFDPITPEQLHKVAFKNLGT